MHVLPAVVPEGEFPRAEVVAVRLARKVGPLFGVRWRHEPFGRTWVCDFASLTLGEIARGAPMPSKEEQARLDARPHDGRSGWEPIGRAVWTPGRSAVPAVLANATLNRFGPDTKAAAVLTAANRLLLEATEAVAAVCAHLARSGTSRPLALATWAGLTLEVFRAQPALVVAAIQARSVQRSLTSRWGSQIALSGLGPSSARCEVGAPGVGSGVDPWHPVRFALIEDTLDALLAAPGPGGEAVGVDRRDDIAAAWCRRLLQMGRPGSGLVWLAEHEGHRVAHSYQRVGAMVAPFVVEVLGTGPAAGGRTVPLPPWPGEPELAGAPASVVRAHATAAHVMTSYLRYADRPTYEAPAPRRRMRAYLGEAAAATAHRLGLDDPAALLLAGYQEYLQVLDLAHDPAPDEAELRRRLTALVAGQRRTAAARQAGRIDPGAASYLLEIGNVALLQTRAQLPPGGELDRELDRALVRGWREALTARGMDPDPSAHLAELNDSQVFHLANYAQYLATRGVTADLRRALRILEAVAAVRDRVAAREPAGLLAKHVAGREAHLMAAGAAAELAGRLPERDRAGRAAAWDTAAAHVRAALENASMRELYSGDWDDHVGSVALHRLEPGLRHLLDTAPESLTRPAREHAYRLADAVLAHTDRRQPGGAGRDRSLRALRARLAPDPPRSTAAGRP